MRYSVYLSAFAARQYLAFARQKLGKITGVKVCSSRLIQTNKRFDPGDISNLSNPVSSSRFLQSMNPPCVGPPYCPILMTSNATWPQLMR
ncbi:hypothetical protein EMIT0P176_20284 [Pseudomonas sp. IT-P176]